MSQSCHDLFKQVSRNIIPLIYQRQATPIYVSKLSHDWFTHIMIIINMLTGPLVKKKTNFKMSFATCPVRLGLLELIRPLTANWPTFVKAECGGIIGVIIAVLEHWPGGGDEGVLVVVPRKDGALREGRIESLVVALMQGPLTTVTMHVADPDNTCALAIVGAMGRLSIRVVQTTTEDTCIRISPRRITDCSPHPGDVHLHTTLVLSGAVCQAIPDFYSRKCSYC